MTDAVPMPPAQLSQFNGVISRFNDRYQEFYSDCAAMNQALQRLGGYVSPDRRLQSLRDTESEVNSQVRRLQQFMFQFGQFEADANALNSAGFPYLSVSLNQSLAWIRNAIVQKTQYVNQIHQQVATIEVMNRRSDVFQTIRDQWDRRNRGES